MSDEGIEPLTLRVVLSHIRHISRVRDAKKGE
jgi:hypothetical protein